MEATRFMYCSVQCHTTTLSHECEHSPVDLRKRCPWGVWQWNCSAQSGDLHNMQVVQEAFAQSADWATQSADCVNRQVGQNGITCDQGTLVITICFFNVKVHDIVLGGLVYVCRCVLSTFCFHVLSSPGWRRQQRHCRHCRRSSDVFTAASKRWASWPPRLSLLSHHRTTWGRFTVVSLGFEYAVMQGSRPQSISVMISYLCREEEVAVESSCYSPMQLSSAHHRYCISLLRALPGHAMPSTGTYATQCRVAARLLMHFTPVTRTCCPLHVVRVV